MKIPSSEYFRMIGRKGGKIGGKKSWNGGFASEIHGKDGLTGQERARIAGRKGGKKSKRGPKKHWW